MPTRRQTLLGGGAALVGALATPALAQTVYRIPHDHMPVELDVNPDLGPGEIHVTTATHSLFWTLGDGRARRYRIAVGAEGRNPYGQFTVARKAEWPSWIPTANMIALEPEVYGPFRAGLPGGHAMNPLGARALYLYQGNRDTFFRIHGTPQPWTMGQSFSSGCVRLINDHIEELYDMVPIGTPVWIS